MNVSHLDNNIHAYGDYISQLNVTLDLVVCIKTFSNKM